MALNDTYVVAHRTIGKWNLEILSDGTVYVSSNYLRQVNYGHRVYRSLFDMGCMIHRPQYLQDALAQAFSLIERGQG